MKPDSLFQTKQAFNKIQVGFCYRAGDSHSAFPFFRFFCKDVTFESFLMCNLSRASHFEALFGTGISLNLWHFKCFIVVPLRRSPQGDAYGASSGNTLRRAERVAKIKGKSQIKG